MSYYLLENSNPQNGRGQHMDNVRIEELPEELRQEVERAAEEVRNEMNQENRAPALPSATSRTRRRAQVKRKLRVPNIQQMEVLEPQQFVISIPDPVNPAEEWDIVVQELSPGQNLILQDTAFMRSAAAARAKIEASNINEDDQSPENLQKLREIYEEHDTNRNFDEYKVEVCLLGIVEPQGLTREIISRWSASNIDRVYNAINGGNEAVDAVDAFPGETTGS